MDDNRERRLPGGGRYHARKDKAMGGLPSELRELIESGPLAHLSTINADGSPQVTVIWIGLDGDDVLSGHMGRYLKVRNVERDPRVVLSFEAPRDRGAFLNPYAVLRARATVEPGEAAWTCSTASRRSICLPSRSSPLRRLPAMSCATRWSTSAASGPGLPPRGESAHRTPPVEWDRGLTQLATWRRLARCESKHYPARPCALP